MLIPHTDQQYQQAAIRLLECFGRDLSTPNLTRGCPDFVFTVVTYGAVSLLKSLEPRLAALEPSPDRTAVLALARSAADMLARAAVTSDHVPASQSVFLSRLIQARSKPPRTLPSAPQPPATEYGLSLPLEFGEMDFAAFGSSVAADDSRTMWPPIPFNFMSRGASPGQLAAANGQPAEDERAGAASDTPTDLAAWVAQSANLALPGPALGLGVGSFGGDGGMLLSHDSFWQSILSTGAPPGMV